MSQESSRVAIAAHIHVLLRRKVGRVTDTEWMARNLNYATEIIRVCRAEDDPDLASWADKLDAALDELRPRRSPHRRSCGRRGPRCAGHSGWRRSYGPPWREAMLRPRDRRSQRADCPSNLREMPSEDEGVTSRVRRDDRAAEGSRADATRPGGGNAGPRGVDARA